MVLGDFEARLARLAEVLTARLVEEMPSVAIRRALLQVAEDYESERERILQRVDLMIASPAVRARSLEIQAQWEDRIATAFARRLGVEGDFDPRSRILAAVTLGAMRIAQRRWLVGGGSERLPTLVTETLDLLDQGTASLDPE